MATNKQTYKQSSLYYRLALVKWNEKKEQDQLEWHGGTGTGPDHGAVVGRIANMG